MPRLDSRFVPARDDGSPAEVGWFAAERPRAPVGVAEGERPPPEAPRADDVGPEALAPEAIVAALRSPAAYPLGATTVEVIETHRAWVFLAGAHAYKLAKPSPELVRDERGLELRQRACQRELELNRRLGKSVYLGVVPVTQRQRVLFVGAGGVVVDWLVDMRRLPHELMLDRAIQSGSVRVEQVDALADTLGRFYASAEAAPMPGPCYRRRLVDDIDAKSASLASPRYGIGRENLLRLSRKLRDWAERHAELVERRSPAIVDAHGDLRPEHVCLEAAPVVIDCLEFDRNLRLLDPLSELSFLALECRRLGAPWIGTRILARLSPPGELAASELGRFYQGYHALVRAAVAVWHLDDSRQPCPDAWRTRAEVYLALGLEGLELSPPREPPPPRG